MSLLNFKEFYGEALGAKSPWKVTDASIDSEARQVRVLMDGACGVHEWDPENGGRAEINDWQERALRHLNCFAALTPSGQQAAGCLPAVGSISKSASTTPRTRCA